MATVRDSRSTIVHEWAGVPVGGIGIETLCGVTIEISRFIYNPRDRGNRPDEPNQQGTPMPISCHLCLELIEARDPDAEADREAAGITVEQLPPIRRRVKRRSYSTVHEYESRSVAGVITLCDNYIIGDELVLDPRADDANWEPLPVNCQSCLELLQSRLMRERGVPPAEQVFQDRGYDIHGKKFEQLKSVVHWISPGECSAWKVQRGTCTSATPVVTCRECKAFPSYKIKHLEHVERARGITAIHLSTEEGTPACGFNNPVNIDTDIALVTCLECLRSVIIPEPEGPPVRRILLDENG